jgi:hypothetical protein
MTAHAEKTPWYKIPIVWLVLAIPFTAVVLGGIMLYLSIISYDGLVVDDYYKEGKEINRVLKRDKAALAHGLRAQVGLSGEQLTLFLVSGDHYTPPPTLEVNYFYSTRAGLDKTTFVEQVQPGVYQGNIGKLEQGRWNVQIEADDWRLIGSMRTPEQEKVVIEPAVKK